MNPENKIHTLYTSIELAGSFFVLAGIAVMQFLPDYPLDLSKRFW